MSKRPSFRPKATPLKYAKIAPTPPPNNSQKPPRLMPILIGGGLLYVTAVYVSMAVFKSKSDTSNGQNKEKEEPVTPGSFDTNPVWEKLAKKYDKEIGWDELVMGIGLMRRWLIGQAKVKEKNAVILHINNLYTQLDCLKGDVLEVSTGTGRNFGYYKADKVSSVTFTDRNQAMLEEAESKFKEYKSQFKAAFQQRNIDEQPAGRYDTVVDTFGLCSCGDPEQALISLAESCKDSDSRILLLEHGRSHYEWLNRILDSNVDKHVIQWGCWWNRDLMGLFEREKVKEKLEIVKAYRWHLGTTCYIVAKPKTTNSQ